MARENQLKDFDLNNFGSTGLKTGVFYKMGGKHSGGKIVCEDGTEVVIPENLNVVSGSVVEFRETNGVAKIERVVELKQEKLSGVLVKLTNGDIKFVEKNMRGLGREFVITNDKNSEKIRAAFGRMVNANVIDDGVVTVDKVFGVVGSLRDDVEAIMDRIGMSQNWSESAQREIDSTPESVDLSTITLVDENGNIVNTETYDKTKPQYIDFRDKMFCTIDPDDCQDMDDSVYTEIDEHGNIVTYAAIADVTEYINMQKTPNLWKEALERGLSAYYPFGAQDMLSHKIASGICSLNENQDRLTMCVKTVINPKTGKRISGEIVHAVINSKKKFSYNEVQKINDENIDLLENTYNEAVKTAVESGANYVPNDLIAALALNKKAAEVLKKERAKRDSLTFDSKKEPKMKISNDGTKIEEVDQRPYLQSMGWIEALMVNANECVAESINKISKFGMYRVHGKPNEYKIDKFNAILEHFGEKGSWDGTKKKLKSIMKKAEENSNYDLVSSNAIMCLDRAKYSVYPHPFDPKTGEVMYDEKCHSALDSEFYTHFTSGIRRFADLAAQYMLKIYERQGELPFEEAELKRMAAHITSREKEIDDAEREIKDLCFAAYVEDHVNEKVVGRVCEIDGDSNTVVVLTDMNMRVKIPIEDFFASKRNLDKYIIDEFGIAVYKDGAEVVSLGQKVECKLAGSNRFMREVYGSLDFSKTFAKPVYTGDADVANRAMQMQYTEIFERKMQEVMRKGNEKQRILDERNERRNSNGKRRNGRSK